MLQRWTLMPGSEDDGEGDDDDAVQKAGDDGANGDALDDDTFEVDLDDAAQDGHDQTTFQYSAVRNTEFLKTPKPGQHLATKSGECRINRDGTRVDFEQSKQQNFICDLDVFQRTPLPHTATSSTRTECVNIQFT
eukprot:m.256487 g.256487  ORF g.256487 m.256487 type:complete len:135 (+) comp26572_c1_seq6:623-1027(+)